MQNLIILLLILTSCTPSIYFVATDTNFEQVQNQPNKKKIIFLSQDINSIENLDLIANNLNRKKWTQVERNFMSFDSTNLIFLRAIKQLIQKEYQASYNAFDSLSNGMYDCQISVLKTDCLYELNADSIDFKKRYQESLNCAENLEIKQIIKTRYRFLRYD